MDKFNFSSQEEFVLLTIAYLQPEAYGYTIKKELAATYNIKLALGTIHTILYRLDRRGYLNSSMGGSDERRGGRSKRLYELSDFGKELLLSLREARGKMYEKIDLHQLVTQK